MARPPEVCPNCGAQIPRNAKACPECGSDEETGWSDEAHASGLDLPDENFDYEEFVRREFQEKQIDPRPSGISWFWWLVTALVLAGFVWLLIK